MTAFELVNLALNTYKETTDLPKRSNRGSPHLRKLASIAGVHHNTMYYWLKGEASPDYNNLRAVLNAAGLELTVTKLTKENHNE